MGRADSDTQQIAYDIVEMLGIIEEAAEYLSDKTELGQAEFIQMYADMQESIAMIKKLAGQWFSQNPEIQLEIQCDGMLFSMEGIIQLAAVSMGQAQEKLAYELIPMLDTACIQFFYYAITEEDESKKPEFRQLLKQKTMNRFIDKAVKTGVYQFDLSIFIQAYNHLDYTRRCVESVLENLPEDIRVELVLFNHGSTDETQEYFESIPNAKVVHVSVNGTFPGIVARVCRGRYCLFVSNDIIITPGAIHNLYHCIDEHADVGWVVPSTPNVSNLQTIPAHYNNTGELIEFAAKNNVYDKRHHEQRVRLCNPVTMLKAETEAKMGEEMYEALNCGQIFSFPDDKSSMWFRRNGYKLILAKDAYCHHFGSVTLGEEAAQEQTKNYTLGRIEMKRKFGIDPWGPGFCYDPVLVEILQFPEDLSDASIMGINCGLGSDPLKIKETLRCEKECHAVLYNFEQDENVIQDLKGVSDEVYLYQNVSEIGKTAGGRHFSYIVMEQMRDEKVIHEYLKEFEKSNISFDFLYLKTEKPDDRLHLADARYRIKYQKEWVCITADQTKRGKR